MKATDSDELVRNLRRRLGLTQAKLAARLGVSWLTISRWENGKCQPSPLALKRLHEEANKARRKR